MLKIARLEIRKSRKKYTKMFMAVTILFIVLAILSTQYSTTTGVKSEYGLYTIATPYKIDDPHFIRYRMTASEAMPYLKSGDIDVALNGIPPYMILSGTEKSQSAADELLKLIKDLFEDELYKRYGIKAFPVFVEAEYLKRELVYQLDLQKVKEEAESADRGKIDEKEAKIDERKKEEIARIAIEEDMPTTGLVKTKTEFKYTTPDNFYPPSLLEKLIYAFFFIIPSYFAIQVFSSSLIEDRVAKRIDLFLSTPISEFDFLIGKMIPYMLFSLITVVAISLIFKESILSIVFIFPVILFFSSLQMFLALISRSYREMTFLVIVSSLIVTAYIFIPSVFAGTIPVSKVSPITLMLALFEGESIGIRDYIFSTFQFYAMAFVLVFMSSRALNPEIMHSAADLHHRILMTVEKIIRKDYHTFFASIASIPFIFMTEFLLLSVLFILPPEQSIPIFLAVVAFVEEVFKGTAVFAAYRNGAPLYKSAVFCSLGFFIGEKLIVILNIATQYNTILLAQYYVLPLLIHLTTMLVFAAILRRSFVVALAASSLLHFIYNYAVVSLL